MPNELLLRVFDHVPNSEMAALLRTSRAWRNVAELSMARRNILRLVVEPHDPAGVERSHITIVLKQSYDPDRVWGYLSKMSRVVHLEVQYPSSLSADEDHIIVDKIIRMNAGHLESVRGVFCIPADTVYKNLLSLECKRIPDIASNLARLESLTVKLSSEWYKYNNIYTEKFNNLRNLTMMGSTLYSIPLFKIHSQTLVRAINVTTLDANEYPNLEELDVCQGVPRLDKVCPRLKSLRLRLIDCTLFVPCTIEHLHIYINTDKNLKLLGSIKRLPCLSRLMIELEISRYYSMLTDMIQGVVNLKSLVIKSTNSDGGYIDSVMYTVVYNNPYIEEIYIQDVNLKAETVLHIIQKKSNIKLTIGIYILYLNLDNFETKLYKVFRDHGVPSPTFKKLSNDVKKLVITRGAIL